MARGILWIVLAMCSLLLAGCSVSVIRPPSASAFMEKKEDKGIVNISGSFFWGAQVYPYPKACFQALSLSACNGPDNIPESGLRYLLKACRRTETPGPPFHQPQETYCRNPRLKHQGPPDLKNNHYVKLKISGSDIYKAIEFLKMRVK